MRAEDAAAKETIDYGCPLTVERRHVYPDCSSLTAFCVDASGRNPQLTVNRRQPPTRFARGGHHYLLCHTHSNTLYTLCVDETSVVTRQSNPPAVVPGMPRDILPYP